MIEGNNHSLMTVCKYCLVDRFNYRFTKDTPDKREIVKAIFSVSSDKQKYKGFSWQDILEIFYKETAFKYDNLNKKTIKKIRKKNLGLVRSTVEATEQV
jgi:hypothetical protein